jgi:hypothetical protein
MGDLLSRATFGFLMAQFFPGAILIYGLMFLRQSILSPAHTAVRLMASSAMTSLDGSFLYQLSVIALCTGAGMLIHGIHWAVLGYLESYGASLTKPNPESKKTPVFETFWHGLRLGWQVLLGPVKLLVEIGSMLLFARDLRSLAIEENAGKIDKEHFEAFEFVQDFYLHFSQFYAHLACALAATLPMLLVAFYYSGFSPKRIVGVVALYVLCGAMFVIGRIQLAGLFIAEVDMASERDAA